MRISLEWDDKFKRLLRSWQQRNPAYTASKTLVACLDTYLKDVPEVVEDFLRMQNFSGSNAPYSEGYEKRKARVAPLDRLILEGDYAKSWVARRTSYARAGARSSRYSWGIGPDPKRQATQKSIAGYSINHLGESDLTYGDLGEVLEALGFEHRDSVAAEVGEYLALRMEEDFKNATYFSFFPIGTR